MIGAQRRRRFIVLLHGLAVLVVVSDVLSGVVDVLTLGALMVATATIGVYCPIRKEV